MFTLSAVVSTPSTPSRTVSRPVCPETLAMEARLGVRHGAGEAVEIEAHIPVIHKEALVRRPGAKRDGVVLLSVKFALSPATGTLAPPAPPEVLDQLAMSAKGPPAVSIQNRSTAWSAGARQSSAAAAGTERRVKRRSESGVRFMSGWWWKVRAETGAQTAWRKRTANRDKKCWTARGCTRAREMVQQLFCQSRRPG